MRRFLTLHPDFRCPAVASISVEASRSAPGVLTLDYRITGAIGDLRLPPPAPPRRTDELWRRTCLEAFVRGPAQSYCELNFAPSREWAAYRFDGYRAGMAPALDIAPTDIEVDVGDGTLDLRATVDLAAATDLAAAPWRLGLSAVIEDVEGAVSYWALAHPPGRPDFHHADGLAAELPLTDRP